MHQSIVIHGQLLQWVTPYDGWGWVTCEASFTLDYIIIVVVDNMTQISLPQDCNSEHFPLCHELLSFCNKLVNETIAHPTSTVHVQISDAVGTEKKGTLSIKTGWVSWLVNSLFMVCHTIHLIGNISFSRHWKQRNVVFGTL